MKTSLFLEDNILGSPLTVTENAKFLPAMLHDEVLQVKARDASEMLVPEVCPSFMQRAPIFNGIQKPRKIIKKI